MTNTPGGAKSSSDNKKADKQPKAAWKKRTASISRWLHIYLSMVSFLIILFFAITGLTLNHADWFDKEQIKKSTGKVQLKWVNVQDTTRIAKLEIVEQLKRDNNIHGDISDFFIDDNQCTISFKGPGYSADAFIDRHTAEYKLTETRLGLFAVMNDLHKGRDTGKKWSYLIDASAIFMTLVSLTGIVMICFMKKKRFSGLILAVIGGIICYLIYKLLVP